MIEVNCDNCGKIFKTLPSKISKSGKKYCSNKCRFESRKNKKDVICAYCGKEYKLIPANIKNINYCSRDCLNKSKITGNFAQCKHCGKEFRAFKSAKERGGGIYCSQECSQLGHRGENYGKRNRGGLSYGRANRIRERDGFCMVCGCIKNLHAHHILHWKEYPELRYDMENGITLCQSCHIKVHRDEIIL